MRQMKSRPNGPVGGCRIGKDPNEMPFGTPWTNPGSIPRIGRGRQVETTERPKASLHPDLGKGYGTQVDQDLLSGWWTETNDRIFAESKGFSRLSKDILVQFSVAVQILEEANGYLFLFHLLNRE